MENKAKDASVDASSPSGALAQDSAACDINVDTPSTSEAKMQNVLHVLTEKNPGTDALIAQKFLEKAHRAHVRFKTPSKDRVSDLGILVEVSDADEEEAGKARKSRGESEAGL